MKKHDWFLSKGSVIALAIVCIAVVLAGGCSKATQKKPLSKTKFTAVKSVWPGEFDKQQGLWLMWPSDIYNQAGRPTPPVTINIVKEAARYIPVKMIASSHDEVAKIKNLLRQNGYHGDNVKYYVVDHYSIWARDVGPVFVRDANNHLQVVNFWFNNYSRDGDPTYVNTENQVDKLIGQQLGLPVLNSSIVTEGGGIESNGRGTMMTTESVALLRNPGMSKQQLETEYKRVLGVSKVIWLKKGLSEDDKITSGHINEIARFASPNTILLAQILPTDRYANKYSQESYLRMEENYQILRDATDQDGKPFKIIRVPMPPTLYEEAAQKGIDPPPVRSYLNYAVTNGAVLTQTYWKPNRSASLKTTEDQVMGIFREVFPGRKIIGIDAENVNLWGGGIHCITQHMPAE